jgi:hypothetical protein
MIEVKRTEILKNYKDFSRKINANMKDASKSSIDSGGALKYLIIDIERKFDNSKIVINQTFSFLFSQPEELTIQTGLTMTIEKSVRSDFYLHFWQRGLIERIFSKNKINSGNLTFDKMFSAKSNNANLTNSIFNNQNVQELFVTNKFLVFNVNSKKGIIKIKLKNMELKKYKTEEIEKYYNNLLYINDLIK